MEQQQQAAEQQQQAADAAEAHEQREQEAEEQAAGEQPEILIFQGPKDPRIGDVTTALNVWLTSIIFQTVISQRIDTGRFLKEGDYNTENLKAYALKGQEAGKAWALAIQKHTDNRCNWQYVHDTFAHVSARCCGCLLSPRLLSPDPHHSLSPDPTPLLSRSSRSSLLSFSCYILY